PVDEGAAAGRSRTAAGGQTDTDGPAPSDEEFQDGKSELHARLQSLARSLEVPTPGEGLGWEPAFEDVRQRAEYLRRQLGPMAPAPDPVEGQLESIRRRLELLRKQIE